jgi:hypothetical protein
MKIATTLLCCLPALVGCREDDPAVGRLTRGLAAICSVEVISNNVSLGVKSVEGDYLPNVVNCESGDLDMEALKVQAVTARTYVYYKLAGGGTKITSGTSVQVYDCARKYLLAQKHYDAVNATSGQILMYQNAPIWPCFNAGVSPTPPPCTAKTGVGADTCCTNNAGKSGSGITQSPCGYVDPTNYKNRGCVCQNGAHCYALQGKTYPEILKAYFGDDIQFVTVTGSCVTPVEGPVKKDTAVAKKDGAAAKKDGAAAKKDGPPATGDGALRDAPGPAQDARGADSSGAEVGGGCSCALPHGSAQLAGGLLALVALLASRLCRRRRARR